MVNLKIVIARVDNTLTESACKSIVEHFNKEPEKMIVKLFASTINIGYITNLTYDEEKKVVIAEAELSIDFKVSGKVLQDLTTPTGKIVLDCKLENVFLKFMEE